MSPDTISPAACCAAAPAAAKGWMRAAGFADIAITRKPGRAG